MKQNQVNTIIIYAMQYIDNNKTDIIEYQYKYKIN